MNLKLTINNVEISNSNILDKIDFITDLGTGDFTVGRLIVPTAKIKLHEDVNIKIGDVVKIYIDHAIYGTYEPYEIKQGIMSREVILYAMPYFALAKTYQPTKEDYTTRSLLLEMQTAIGFNIVDFEDIVAIDMKNVKADTGVNLLQAIAMILGVNCFITEYGEILFKLIGNNTARYTVTTRNGEYIQTLANEDLIVIDTDIHQVAQSQITKITKTDTTDYHITRIIGKLNDSDENPIIVGTQANSWNDLTLINPYLTESICSNILATLPHYSGFELTIFNAPLLRPLDKIVFTYKNVEYTIPIMNLTLTFSVGGLVAKVQACVSNAQEKSSNYKGSLTTKLEVVKNVQSELNTKVEVVDGKVSSLITRTDVIEGEQTTIKDSYSQINQTLGEIDLRVGTVETDVGKKVPTNEIISSINLSTEGVKIKGDKIQLTGGTIVVNADGSSMSLDEYLKAEDDSENFVLTPNFNSGSLSPNWTWSVGAFVYVDTTYKHGESTACRLNGSASAIVLNTSHFSINKLEKRKTYKLSVWVYCTATSSVTGQFDLRLNGKADGSTSSVVIDKLSFNGDNLRGNQWTRLGFEITPDQDYSAPSISIGGVSGSIDAWVTDFELVQKGELFTQEQLINIINGAGDGFYILDGQAYINAEYIQTGTMRADLIKVQVDGTSNLMPFNYVTLDNAINTTNFSVMSTDDIPYLNCQLPIYQGGASSDVMCTAIGYSDVEIEAGKDYYFMCEYYAVWGNDTKPDDGTGTSTATSGSKNGGLQNGQNMTLFLYDGTNYTKINHGRNLLDGTAGNKPPRMFSAGTYAESGFALSVSTANGGTTMRCASTTEENYLRFMPPVANEMYGLEAGCTYTLSGYAWGTMSEIHIRHQYHVNGGTWAGSDTYPVPVYGDGETEKYFEYTFTIPSNAVGFYLSFQDYARVLNKWVCISKLKLEKSSKATPWCLSPADKGEENPTYVEESSLPFTLATVYDFNSSVKIEERESYPGVYQRTWTTLIARITATESYKGKLCINLDCSGFFYNGEGGSFYIRRFQLTDAKETNPVFIDYTKQVKEKHMELTDGSYYKNIVGVDGMQIENGKITGNYPLSRRTFEIDDDGFKCRATTGNENAFVGVNQSYYTYDGGSSGQITGYDDIYGFGCTEIVNGSREGIFVGVHHGFQKPNSTSYGRADIYTLYKDGYAYDTHDWTLLGAKVEPNALVRRDDKCNITSNGIFITGDASNTDFSQGGTTYHGSVMFSEPLYTTTGNGQIINVHKDNQKIYFGNPNSQIMIESGNVLQAKYNGTTYNLGALLANSASAASIDDEEVEQPEILKVIAQLQAENEELKRRVERLESLISQE